MPDMLADTCLTLCCYKLAEENAVVYSLLVNKNVDGIFFLLYFYGVGCLVFSLISAKQVTQFCDLKLCYRNKVFPSVRIWGFIFTLPSVVFLKHFDFFMVRTLIYDTQGTFSAGNIRCSVKNAPEGNLKGHKVK